MQQSLDFQQGGNGVVVGGPLPGISRVTLPETNIAPENEWLEDDPFLLVFGLFSGAKMLVSGRVYTLTPLIGVKETPGKPFFLAVYRGCSI